MAGLTSYALTGSGGGASATYSWDFGDGSSGSGASVNQVYASNGTFTVTLTCRNEAGSATSTTTISTERDMTGVWAGPFNNRNTRIQLGIAGSGVSALDQGLTGTYADQFDGGTATGTLSADGICPCNIHLDIVIPGVASFALEGQRVDENTINGQYVGDFPSLPTTLVRQ
jgi:PKD repeat protein